MKVYGKNAVNELLNNNSSIKKIYLSDHFKDSDIIKIIKDKHIQYENMNQKKLDSLAPHNQGILAITNDYEYKDLDDFLEEEMIVILDHLEDPHNFGAIIRTCEAAGVKCIVIPKDRSVSVNETVMKTSTGALTYVSVCMVNNLNNAIKKLQDNGYFVYGAEANGIDYREINYASKKVLVIGSEGFGLSSLVAKNCDEIVSLPMNGHVNSLNASVAAGILIYQMVGK